MLKVVKYIIREVEILVGMEHRMDLRLIESHNIENIEEIFKTLVTKRLVKL